MGMYDYYGIKWKPIIWCLNKYGILTDDFDITFNI